MLSTRLSILFVKMMSVNKNPSAPHSAYKMRTSILTRVDALRRSTAEFRRVRGVFGMEVYKKLSFIMKEF